MALNNSKGTTASIISSSTPVEMMRLAGTMQPVNVLSIPRAPTPGPASRWHPCRLHIWIRCLKRLHRRQLPDQSPPIFPSAQT
jgi:hypothetical protein